MQLNSISGVGKIPVNGTVRYFIVAEGQRPMEEWDTWPKVPKVISDVMDDKVFTTVQGPLKCIRSIGAAHDNGRTLIVTRIYAKEGDDAAQFNRRVQGGDHGERPAPTVYARRARDAKRDFQGSRRDRVDGGRPSRPTR